MLEYGTADDIWWQGEAACFYVREGQNKILCRISKEAIQDHFGNPDSDGDCLDAAKLNFDEISDMAGDKTGRGLFEPDGTVLLRTLDW